MKTSHQNDYKRFVSTLSFTDSGEVAEKEHYCIDADAIVTEEVFDGFYTVCTNLEDSPSAIIKDKSNDVGKLKNASE